MEKTDSEKIQEVIDSSYKPRSVFKLDSVEQKAYAEFIEEHRKSCPDTSTACGGAYSITFNITTLGLTKVMQCGMCGKKKNITNFENW
jgi:hypothetical protein